MKISLQLVFFFFSIALYAQQQPTILNQPYIETSAEADSLVIPDKIHISALLNEADFRGKKSVEEQEELFKQALVKAGVDIEKDVTLLDFGSDYKRYFLKGKDILKTKSFSILVRNATMVSRVLTELEEAGISNVMITSVEYSDVKNLLLHLKGVAVTRAKEQAEALTIPLSQKVGKALRITDIKDADYASVTGGMGSIMIRGVGSIYGNRGSAVNFEVDFDKIRFKAAVQVIFALE